MRYIESNAQFHKALPTSETIYKVYLNLIDIIQQCIFEDIKSFNEKNLEDYYSSSYKNLFKEIDFLKENIINKKGIKPFENMCKMHNILYERLYKMVTSNKEHSNPYAPYSNRISLYSMTLDSIEDIFGLNNKKGK